MGRGTFTTQGFRGYADQVTGFAPIQDPPAAIESTIAALARSLNAADAKLAVRSLDGRHYGALARHLRERPMMFPPLVRELVLEFLAAPDAPELLNPADGGASRLKAFNPRLFASRVERS